jgi:hypothetical protein
MPTEKFDGKIDGKQVKVIVKDKGFTKMYFAKPKNFDTETPHFEVKVDGALSVHIDSPDGKSFRVMGTNSIYGGSFYSGSTFASNKGMDIAVLPMNPTANGFVINTSENGSYIKLQSEKEWCLMAFGTFGPWQPKPKQET